MYYKTVCLYSDRDNKDLVYGRFMIVSSEAIV